MPLPEQIRTKSSPLCSSILRKIHVDANHHFDSEKSCNFHKFILQALRIVLRSIESHANRYARYITPLLSLSIDFYIRIFVRLHTSQKAVKDSVW